jgi:sulfide:quinone oxidoreductase
MKKIKENRMQEHIGVETARFRVVIIGGGTAGIITASLLQRARQTGIAIIEPSNQHFYQPIWTLVGAGVVRKEVSARREVRYIPKGVRWIQDSVEEIAPDQQYVRTQSGGRIGYDFLVVAAGIQLNWDAIPGLQDAIRRGDASSNCARLTTPTSLHRPSHGSTPSARDTTCGC